MMFNLLRWFLFSVLVLLHVACAYAQDRRPYVGMVLVNLGDGYSAGSCVLIDDNLALTNHHVIREAKGVTLIFGATRRQATILKSDKDFDLALLKFDEEVPGAHRIGIVDDEDYVTTCGFKHGLEYKEVTGKRIGWISPPKTEDGEPGMFFYHGKVWPGMSGGPMVGRNGYLVGLVWGSHEDKQFGIRASTILEFLEGTEFQPRVFGK